MNENSGFRSCEVDVEAGAGASSVMAVPLFVQLFLSTGDIPGSSAADASILVDAITAVISSFLRELHGATGNDSSRELANTHFWFLGESYLDARVHALSDILAS